MTPLLNFAIALLPIAAHALPPLPAYALTPSNRTLSDTFLSCLPQMPAGLDQVPVADYSDCIKIILGFTTGLQPKEPATFSRNTWTGVRLPRKGIHNNCVFELDMYKDVVEEVASTLDIAIEAGKMAKECVLKEPRTGGVAIVGPRNGIEIILHGATDWRGANANVMQGWQHVGCDHGDGVMALTEEMSAFKSIPVEHCATECAGYQFLGIRWGTQCFCGNTIATTSPTRDSDLSPIRCRNVNAMSIYTAARNTTAIA